MSELDVIKTQIAYLQVWLGIMVVTDISLFGWLVSNAGEASLRLVSGCSAAAIAITAGIVFLHRRIERHIASCRIPDDHISISRLPLFLAREVLRALAEDQKTYSGALPA